MGSTVTAAVQDLVWDPGAGAEQHVVAFQGARGAFSDEVIATVWQGRAATRPARDFASAVHAVVTGRATHAVLPVENTTIGPITESCGAIAAVDSLITLAEISVPIRHCLLGVSRGTLADVRRVHSHPAALAQCRTFLAGHPAIDVIAAYDTAGAAELVAALARVDAAAIAPARAAAIYGLTILARDIQDRADNVTRFAIVARAGGAHVA